MGQSRALPKFGPEQHVMAENAHNPSERDLRLDEAIAAFYQASEAGQALDRSSFLARYPDLADELAAFLDDKSAFEKQA